MKKSAKSKLALVTVLAYMTLAYTGCGEDENLMVNSNSKENKVTTVSDTETEETDVFSGNQDETEETAKTEETDATDIVSEESTVEVSSEADGNKMVVVTEDNVRYTRIESSSVYSDEEVEKLNETMKKIQHDAVDKFGHGQRTDIYEKQNATDTSVTAMIPDSYLKNIWIVENASVTGETVLYDAETLEVLTFKSFIGDNWKDWTTEDTEVDDKALDCYMDISADGSQISIYISFYEIHVDVPMENINQKYVK